VKKRRQSPCDLTPEAAPRLREVYVRPLYPRKRTFVGNEGVSANGEKRTPPELFGSGIKRVTIFRFDLAPRLNNRSLALADRCFAFTPASGEADGENYRANCNHELFHEVTPRSKNHIEVSLFFHLQLVQKGHTADANF
jgi:hypothetical protein